MDLQDLIALCNTYEKLQLYACYQQATDILSINENMHKTAFSILEHPKLSKSKCCMHHCSILIPIFDDPFPNLHPSSSKYVRSTKYPSFTHISALPYPEIYQRNWGLARAQVPNLSMTFSLSPTEDADITLDAEPFVTHTYCA